jgi:hypothetical protein
MKGNVILEAEAECVSGEGNKTWASYVLARDVDPPGVRLRVDVHLVADGPVPVDGLQHGKKYVVTLSEYGDEPAS